MISFEYVGPTEESVRLIYNLRFEPGVITASFRQKQKSFEQFFEDFASDYFLVKELPPFFVLYNGTRIGFMSFKPYHSLKSNISRACVISIMLEQAYRGQGLGSQALKKAQEFAKRQGFHEMYAEIKSGNSASKKAFEKAGFCFVSSGTHTVYEDGQEKKIPMEIFRVGLSPIQKHKVFVIAEIGSNYHLGSYEQDFAMAKALISLAKEAGVDAVKFQTFRPDKVYAKGAGKSYYLSKAGFEVDIEKLFEELAMPYDLMKTLAAFCKEIDIEFMSSTFSKEDFEAVDPFVRRHKIASYEISHLRLLQLAGKSGKPLILSCGASTIDDIAWAIETFKKAGGKEITLLQCTAQYPAKVEAMNLRTIPWLQSYFGVPVGLSDHSRDPIIAPIGAVALGATVIEKHFTLDNRLPGPDHAFAILPDELRKMVRAIRTTEEMLGDRMKKIDPEEQELYSFAKRRIQTLCDIEKGQELHEDQNIAILRPGSQTPGVHPRFLEEIEGKKATRNLHMGEGVQFGDFAS
jgi:N-acetylneuraminate synthase